ncbi:hypothetical protein QQ008_29605 [Fulvivirgaceae bacterium BMA10]|uniref:Uncharacterized protein n=1 Tax=Splendidivirga corallicola TaxID=3051826 RepID=A0ABT8L098_9BACT|nr:hypothetical protein [Fulvivirgaceae bacterium BMA10]
MPNTKKPTIFLIDSDDIDISILTLKIEREISCRVYTFFDVEEVLNYSNLLPDVLVMGANIFNQKRDVIQKIESSLLDHSQDHQASFIIYRPENLFSWDHNPIHGEDRYTLVPLDHFYNYIQLSLTNLLKAS